jgi:DNA adenine methylase
VTEQLSFDFARVKPARAKPIVKWLGGKSWLTGVIGDTLIERVAGTPGARYFEPFVGGAAMAAYLGLQDMVLGDACGPLIDTYYTITESPREVAHALNALYAAGVDEASYYRVRDIEPTLPLVAAARFIYLNKLGFNGLYRVNRAGKFNVPYGKKFKDGVNPYSDYLWNEDATTMFDDFAAALVRANLLALDFRETLDYAVAGDVVFCDPPYADTFTGYTAGGFGPDAQQDLAVQLQTLADIGATIVMTNADTAEIRALYAWATICPTAEPRAVSRDGAQRGKAPCILITNDETIAQRVRAVVAQTVV